MGAASSERSSGRLADTRPPPVGALEDGSGEVTLVVYSVFMAATSLLLLLLAHVHQVHSGSSAADGAAPAFALASPRTWLAGLLAAVARLHGLVASAAALLAAIDIRTLLCTAAGLVTILSIGECALCQHQGRATDAACQRTGPTQATPPSAPTSPTSRCASTCASCTRTPCRRSWPARRPAPPSSTRSASEARSRSATPRRTC
jgi:hypothetical protein